MVAHQQKRRHVIGQTLYALGELTLLGLLGITIFEGVASKDRQVGLVFDGVIDYFIKPIEEIAHAG